MQRRLAKLDRNDGLVATVSARALMRLAPSFARLREGRDEAPAVLLHDAALVGTLQHHRQRLRGRHVVARRRALVVSADARVGVEDAGHLRGVGDLGHASAHRRSSSVLRAKEYPRGPAALRPCVSGQSRYP